MFKKFISFLFVFALLVNFNSMTASASELEPINKQDEFISKIIDYVAYDENNKPYFITEDLNILNITQEELDDVKKGFEMAEEIDFGLVSEEVNEDEEGVSTYAMTSYDSNYLYVTFTESEVKAYLTVGIVGGLALAIGGTLASGGTLVVAGITMTKGAIVSAVGQSILGFSTLLTLWWNPKTVTLKIPIPIFKPKSGNVYYTGKNTLGINDTKSLYIAF